MPWRPAPAPPSEEAPGGGGEASQARDPSWAFLLGRAADLQPGSLQGGVPFPARAPPSRKDSPSPPAAPPRTPPPSPHRPLRPSPSPHPPLTPPAGRPGLGASFPPPMMGGPPGSRLPEMTPHTRGEGWEPRAPVSSVNNWKRAQRRTPSGGSVSSSSNRAYYPGLMPPGASHGLRALLTWCPQGSRPSNDLLLQQKQKQEHPKFLCVTFCSHENERQRKPLRILSVVSVPSDGGPQMCGGGRGRGVFTRVT